MLLSLVLAAAPFTVSVSPEGASFDGKVFPIAAEYHYLNLPDLEGALRAKLGGEGALEVRIEADAAARFRALKVVMFTVAAAGDTDADVQLGAAEPFRQTSRRKQAFLQVQADGGVPTAAYLRSLAGRPDGDRAVNLAVGDEVTVGTLAPVVQACRSAGYQVALVPRDVASPRAGPGLPPGEPLADGGTVVGKLAKEMLRAVIHANRQQWRSCFEPLVKVRPDAGGKVSVRFVVAASGEVPSAEVVEDSLGDRGVAACLAAGVKRLRFPPPSGGGTVVITYPFIFKRQEPEGTR